MSDRAWRFKYRELVAMKHALQRGLTREASSKDIEQEKQLIEDLENIINSYPGKRAKE